jgi:ADP-heptose:LPS heptosyltransferase
MTPLLFSVRIPTLLAIFWRKRVARKAHFEGSAGRPRSIIVFRLDQLGDVVLTTPLFRELKRLYPNSRRTVVVQPDYQSILTTNHNIDEILPLHAVEVKWLPARASRLVSALWFYWTRLRHRRFDLAISPRWDVDESMAAMLCVLTNTGKRVGHSERVSEAKRQINRGFDGAFDVVVPSGTVRHEVDRNLEIVEVLGGRVEDRSLDVCLTASDRRFASELLTHHEQHRILVAIGIGGRAAARRWPLSSYAELIVQLNLHRAMQPIIVCAREEEAEAAQLADMLPVRPYIVSGVPLRAACAVLERCDLFVGNDSGTAHLAAAMDCRTIVISKHPQGGDPNHANSPARFGPRCSQYRVVQPIEGAGDCRDSCRAVGPHCIRLVTVEMVVAAALDLLRPEQEATFKREVRYRSIVPAEIGVAEEVNLLKAARTL